MKNIRLSFAVLLLGLTALWLLSETLPPWPPGVFALRQPLIYGTGFLALGVMGAALLLAARPLLIEPWLGGQDKAYRLHKWLGIAALVLAVLHWLWAKAPKWAVGWGWLERPQRGPRPSTEDLPLVYRWLQELRGPAEEIGEWAFYGVVLLIALALLKRFPYRYFAKVHRLLAPLYLLLVFHGLVLMRPTDWGVPIGLLSLLLAGAGSAAALRSLTRKLGQTRRAVGEVEALERHPDHRVLRVDVRLKQGWPGHQAGQFAFLGFDRDEGLHPFTICSAWQGDGRLSFLIKALGDYTAALPETLKPGDLLTVEGPYGRFDFSGTTPRQIWVAGGIGITPFIARLQALAQQRDGKQIDLFYSTRVDHAGTQERLREMAEQAGVRLHVLVAPQQGRLDAAAIARLVPQWREAELWFCGPAGFGQALRGEFQAMGLPAGRFHQELFEMR